MNYKASNKRLLKFIKSYNILNEIFKDGGLKNVFFNLMEFHIDKNTHHTFGRILIDHFLDDYKNGKENIAEKVVIEKLYKDVENIEKENPADTLKRLEKDINEKG